MHISKYLDKIINGEDINFNIFLSKLPSEWSDRWRDIFTCIKTSNTLASVAIIDAPLFESLSIELGVSWCRAEAALRGNSHAVNTSISHIIVGFNSSQGLYPDVVVCDGENWWSNHKNGLSDNLLIIENEENYARKNSLIPLFPDSAILKVSDCLFGSGMQVADKNIKPFISMYKNVFVMVDYDLGGLRIFKALRKKYGSNVHFLTPDNIEQYYDRFKLAPKSTDNWLTSIEMAQEFGLDKLVKAFVVSEKFMEQEALLTPLGKSNDC